VGQVRGHGREPDGGELPYSADLGRGRLRRAAGPVIDRLAEQLSLAPATILLADQNARIIDRRAGSSSLLKSLDRAMVAPGFGYAEKDTGTNGIGTALEERRLFQVRGGEHYREGLQDLACTGMPIVHPIGRTVEGILDITCQVADATELMSPLVLAAVRDIEARLYAQSTHGEQALLEAFLRVSRRGRTAVVTISPDMILANSAASRLLDPSDQTLLWTWATRVLDQADEYVGEVQLARETTVAARARRVADDRSMLGVIIELRPVENTPGQSSSSRTAAAGPGAPRARSPLVGRSLATRRLRSQLELLAASPGPVLITGESGVGKGHAAEYLVRLWDPTLDLRVWDAAGKDAENPDWVDELRTHLDRGGAVLVRRIDELPAQTVPRFEALVEESTEGNAPLVATTRGIESPESIQLHAHFIRRIWVVPLRQRTDEIEDLARVLLSRHVGTAQVPRLQPAALRCLMSHDWPGNVRELESALASAMIRSMHGDITVQHLPDECRSPALSKRLTSLERAEREAVMRALEETGGNKAVAAERLGIARSTLYRKIRSLGLENNRFDSD